MLSAARTVLVVSHVFPGVGVACQILSAVLGLGGTAAASGLDIGAIISAFVTGGVSGGLTALVIALIKSKMSA